MMADEENNKDVELQSWFNGFWREDEFDPNKIFTSLASKHRDGLPCVLSKRFFGSFHICVRVVFDDGIYWIIRVPLPFRLLQRDAHTEREVAILQCLRERTVIPVLEIIAYGFGGTRHPALGPFIITTFIHAIPLTDWWKDPKSKETRLRSDIDEEVVKKVYRQAANIILELASLRFSAIGTLAATDDEHLTWSIKSPPWSITLHEAERNHGIQPQAADGPFDNVKDWLSYIFNHHEKIILEIPGPTQSQDLLNLRRF
ncbi:hypothetical protein V501_07259 [Pseudogymnoascus sp. VKM F-4519 (FW-2642)]|nr:hypothetical protein V501_07259 [Pseudogymnoascus sp. VKM F-4519 (FW-2642)]